MTLFVIVFGLICAMTPLGKLPVINELSTTYLYAVVSLLASTATLADLLSAPIWIVYGLLILVVHIVLMFVQTIYSIGISACVQQLLWLVSEVLLLLPSSLIANPMAAEATILLFCYMPNA